MLSKACFEILYAPLYGELNRPETELILIIRPGCLAEPGLVPSKGRKRLVILLMDFTLTSSCFSNCCSDRCSNGPGIAIPALLINPAKVSQCSKTTFDALTTSSWFCTSNSSGVNRSG